MLHYFVWILFIDVGFELCLRFAEHLKSFMEWDVRYIYIYTYTSLCCEILLWTLLWNYRIIYKAISHLVALNPPNDLVKIDISNSFPRRDNPCYMSGSPRVSYPLARVRIWHANQVFEISVQCFILLPLSCLSRVLVISGLLVGLNKNTFNCAPAMCQAFHTQCLK